MPDTTTLYRHSGDAKAALDALDADENDALYQIELIVDRLRERTGASHEDARRLLNHVIDGLSDMLGDIRVGYRDALGDADEALASIEARDLMVRTW